MPSPDRERGLSDLIAGARLGGRYRLLSRLGVGGMGEVWLALLEGAGTFRRRVVLKCVAASRRDDERIAKMLEDEARILGLLNHHGIVAAVDFVLAEEGPILILEHVDGPSLRSALRVARRRHAPLPEGLAAWLGAEVARALHSAHQACDGEGRPLNLVHRDVSPDNVLISREGSVKLADFGVARALGNQDVTYPGSAPKGKRGYMAPEQAALLSVGPRADLFALGRVIAEAADLGCGPRLRAVLDKATAGRPEDRYANGGAMAVALIEACPPPLDAEGALAEWLRTAAPEALEAGQGALAETPVFGQPRIVPAPAAHPAPFAPLPEPIAPTMFAGVAPVRTDRRWLALAVVGAVAFGAGGAWFITSERGSERGVPAPAAPAFLTPQGQLKVRSSPPGAEVYVDGQLKGTTPVEMKVPAGKHDLRVGSVKMERWRALEVVVAAGGSQSRDVDLTE